MTEIVLFFVDELSNVRKVGVSVYTSIKLTESSIE
jgi:hypothetical protein